MTPPPLKHRPALPPTLITMFAEVRNCAVEAAILALSPRVVSWKAAVCTPLTVKRAPGCVRHETPGGGSGAMTAISEWPRTSSLVAVIAAVPPVRAVTIPAGVTVATCTSSLVHVTGRPASAWPRESFGVALSGRVWPESKVAVAGVTSTDATGGGGGGGGGAGGGGGGTCVRSPPLQPPSASASTTARSTCRLRTLTRNVVESLKRTSHLNRRALLDVAGTCSFPATSGAETTTRTPLHGVTELPHRVGPSPRRVRLAQHRSRKSHTSVPATERQNPSPQGGGVGVASVARPSVTDGDRHAVRGGGVARGIPCLRGERIRAVRGRMRIPPQRVLRRRPGRRHLRPDRLAVQLELHPDERLIIGGRRHEIHRPGQGARPGEPGRPQRHDRRRHVHQRGVCGLPLRHRPVPVVPPRLARQHGEAARQRHREAPRTEPHHHVVRAARQLARHRRHVE